METELKKMISLARQARDRAYAPYSNHPVGAALLTEDGHIYAGCNVENAATPLSQCAERLAVGNMVINGERGIAHLVVIGPGDVPCTPCGGCRQLLAEFGSAETKVTVCGKDGEILLQVYANELLPHSFGPANLGEIRENDGE